MNIIKKIFGKDDEVKVEEKAVKKEPKAVNYTNKKEEYKIEKEKRKKIAQENRAQEAKKLEEAKIEEANIREEAKNAQAIIQAKKLEEHKAEAKKVKEVKQIKAEKVEEPLDLYGFEVSTLKKGDIVEAEILSHVSGVYYLRALNNYQEAILEDIEIEGEVVNVGDKIEVLIYKYYAEVYYASRRRLLNKRNLITQLDAIDDEEILKGKVVKYKEPHFTVELENGLKGQCYIRNIDKKFVNSPDEFIDNDYEFAVVRKIPNSHHINFELNRKMVQIKREKEIVGSIAVGQVITITDYSFNKGGLEFFYNSLRGFVPLREISHKYFENTEVASKEITGDLEVKIIEIQKKRDGVNIIGSVKQTVKSPWDLFVETHVIGQVLNAPVIRKENYGLFIELAEGVRGLLHSSDFSTELAAKSKDIKINEKLDVRITSIDLEKRQVNLSTHEESVVEENIEE